MNLYIIDRKKSKYKQVTNIQCLKCKMLKLSQLLGTYGCKILHAMKVLDSYSYLYHQQNNYFCLVFYFDILQALLKLSKLLFYIWNNRENLHQSSHIYLINKQESIVYLYFYIFNLHKRQYIQLQSSINKQKQNYIKSTDNKFNKSQQNNQMTLNYLSATSPVQLDAFVQDQRSFFEHQMALLVKSNQKLSNLQHKMKSLIKKNTFSQNIPFDQTNNNKFYQKLNTKKTNSRTLITEQNLLNNDNDLQEQDQQSYYKNISNPVIRKKSQHKMSRRLSNQDNINEQRDHQQTNEQSSNTTANQKKSSLKIFPKKRSCPKNNKVVNIAQNKVYDNQTQRQNYNIYNSQSKYLNRKQNSIQTKNHHQRQNQCSRPSASKSKIQFQKQYRFELMQQIQSIEQMMKKCVFLKQQKIQQLLYEIERDKEQKLILYEKNQKLEKQLKQLEKSIDSESLNQMNKSQYSANLQKKQIQLLKTLQCQQKKLKDQGKSLKFEVRSMQRHFNNLLKKGYYQKKSRSKQKLVNNQNNINRNKSSKSLRNCCLNKNKSINQKNIIPATTRKTQQKVLKSLVTQLNKIKGLVLNQIVRNKSKSQIVSYKYR